jgi:hypothetical protein
MRLQAWLEASQCLAPFTTAKVNTRKTHLPILSWRAVFAILSVCAFPCARRALAPLTTVRIISIANDVFPAFSVGAVAAFIGDQLLCYLQAVRVIRELELWLQCSACARGGEKGGEGAHTGHSTG